MEQPIVVRNTFATAAVAALQALMPAVIAVGLLYLSVFAYNAPRDDMRFYHVLAVLVAGLSLLMSQTTPMIGAGSALERTMPIALSVIVRWLVVLAVLLAIGYVTKFSAEYSRRVVLSWAALTPALVVLSHLILNEIMRRVLADPSNRRKVVFVGCNDASEAVAAQLQRNGDAGMNVLGCFDDRSSERLGPSNNLGILGKLHELTDYVRTHGIDVIFIALPMRHLPRVVDLIEGLKDTTASVYYVPNMFVADLVQSRARTIHGIPVVALCETPLYGIHGVSKRLTDIVLASAILTLAMPVMFITWLLVKMTSPGPGIFAQRRYGLNGEEITIYKFRTMRVLEDGVNITQATRDDPRVTSIGRILRRYSIDELPQLINVIQGRMSLVGPRPHAVAHNEMYRKLIKGYMIRHKVRPGITGLAQVNGLRGETRTLEQMEARVRYDLEYVRTWSVGLDVQILVKTIVRVLVDGKAY